LAIQILATQDPQLQTQVIAYRQELWDQVRAKEDRLQQLGYQAYLDQMQRSSG